MRMVRVYAMAARPGGTQTGPDR
jgi:hypothetical protein